MMAKCSSSISTSFAYVFFISSLFGVCFFSFYYFQTQHIVVDIHALMSKNIVLNSTTTAPAPTPAAGAALVSEELEIEELEIEDDDSTTPTAQELDLAFPPKDVPREERIAWFKQRASGLRILKSTARTKLFDQRVKDFLGTNSSSSLSSSCRMRFFMTWIAPASQFGKREFNSLESVLKSHPGGCVVILSRGLDSDEGLKILEPLLQRGYKILPVTPDLPFLASDNPAHAWLEGLKKGTVDPGTIPITHNLSNLIQILVLYKYGGIYLDLDMIIIKSLSKLRNTIGVQTVNEDTQTLRDLNNAVLIFDQQHPILLRFIQEFSTNFDGSVWGHNGPYMVTRVVKQVLDDSRFQFNMMSQPAFYPVDWANVAEIFERPKSRAQTREDKEKLNSYQRQSYGIHLWNNLSHNLRIQPGSIIGQLISNNCILCRDIYDLDAPNAASNQKTTTTTL